MTAVWRIMEQDSAGPAPLLVIALVIACFLLAAQLIWSMRG